MRKAKRKVLESSELDTIITRVKGMCEKAIAFTPHDITDEDIMKEFYREEDIEICKKAGPLILAQQKYETWRFDTKHEGDSTWVRITSDNKSYLRPDYVTMLDQKMTPYLRGRLGDWLTTTTDIHKKFERFRMALKELSSECTTLSQVLFYWPTLRIIPINYDALSKRIEKAYKISPTQKPALSPESKEALRDMTQIINAVKLMPDDVPNLPVKVELML